MPTPSVDAEVLRRRATALRRLAHSMSTSEAVLLRLRAGADVWIGPTASRCCDELTTAGRRLLGAADDLIVRARVLERRALELETLAIGAGAH